ncbi:conjugal transfer protein TraB, partial [Citrobacter freundii]|nr:conjugal transfer protein TraB [Citrobacter freundii]
EQNFATLSQQFEQNKLDTNEKMARKDAEIQRLTEQLNQRPAGSNPQTPPADQNGTPLPGPVAAGQSRPAEYSVPPTG